MNNKLCSNDCIKNLETSLKEEGYTDPSVQLATVLRRTPKGMETVTVFQPLVVEYTKKSSSGKPLKAKKKTNVFLRYCPLCGEKL